MKFYGKGMDKNGNEQIVKGGLNAMKVSQFTLCSLLFFFSVMSLSYMCMYVCVYIYVHVYMMLAHLRYIATSIFHMKYCIFCMRAYGRCM